MTIAEKEQGRPGAPASSGRGGGPALGVSGGVKGELCPYPADPTFDELGYKVLLYLTRCFRGRVLGSAEPLSAGDTAEVGGRG